MGDETSQCSLVYSAHYTTQKKMLSLSHNYKPIWSSIANHCHRQWNFQSDLVCSARYTRGGVRWKRMFHTIPNRSPNLQRWKTIYNNPSLASCILTNCLQQLLHSTTIPSLHFVHLPKIWNSTISKKAKATNLTGKLICSLNRSLQKLRHW